MLKLLLKIYALLHRLLHWCWGCVTDALEFIGLLFEQHKLARRVLLFWAMYYIGMSINRFWENLSVFTGRESIVLAIIGLLTIVLGFYQWSRERDK